MLGEKNSKNSIHALRSNSVKNTTANQTEETSPKISHHSEAEKENSFTPLVTAGGYPTPQSSVTASLPNPKRKAETFEEIPAQKKVKGEDGKINIFEFQDISASLPVYTNNQQQQPRPIKPIKKSSTSNFTKKKPITVIQSKVILDSNRCSSVFSTGSPSTVFNNKSSGASVIPTPTRTASNQPLAPLCYDSVNEKLENISNPELVAQKLKRAVHDKIIDIDPTDAFELEFELSPIEVPLFNSLCSVWIDSIDREKQVAKITSPNCLLKVRNEITVMDRWRVLNWIREICCDNRLTRTTFQASILYLDGMLEAFECHKSGLQLIAVAALLIATKLHDTLNFTVESLMEFIWNEDETDIQNRILVQDAIKFVIKYEHKFTMHHHWNIFVPIPIDFLRHSFHFAALKEDIQQFEPFPDGFYNSMEEDVNSTVMHQKYNTTLFLKAVSLLDDALLDFDSLNFAGSKLAAGVFWKTYPMDQKDNQQKELLLKIATGYCINQLEDVLEFLEPYSFSVEDLYAVLSGEFLSEILGNAQMLGFCYRLEELQTPSNMLDSKYDDILRKRAKKLNQPFKSFIDQY